MYLFMFVHSLQLRTWYRLKFFFGTTTNINVFPTYARASSAISTANLWTLAIQQLPSGTVTYHSTGLFPFRWETRTVPASAVAVALNAHDGMGFSRMTGMIIIDNVTILTVAPQANSLLSFSYHFCVCLLQSFCLSHFFLHCLCTKILVCIFVVL